MRKNRTSIGIVVVVLDIKFLVEEWYENMVETCVFMRIALYSKELFAGNYMESKVRIRFGDLRRNYNNIGLVGLFDVFFLSTVGLFDVCSSELIRFYFSFHYVGFSAFCLETSYFFGYFRQVWSLLLSGTQFGFGIVRQKENQI